jgi:tRNA A37 threonylcarbamoyladenosine synthetase subunit TsaC/SUA5/YrdC
MLHYFSDPEEIEERFHADVDLFVDDGPGGYEASTVVDCTGNEPILLREGKGKL